MDCGGLTRSRPATRIPPARGNASRTPKDYGLWTAGGLSYSPNRRWRCWYDRMARRKSILRKTGQ